MIATLLVVLFVGLMLAGVPIAVALGLGGMIAIVAANAASPWWGLLAAPQNMHASIAKYPLLALPMFVLVGSIFDRSGVARRMVTFAEACVGRAPGTLPAVAILVAMVLGGISGSGPANAAAVGGVMIAAMSRAGYPPSFSASVVGAAAATDILIPPSVAFIIYSVLVPGASVPALFAAGMIPGILAGIALIIPAVWMARKHKMGALESTMPRPPFWKSLREATWGLAGAAAIALANADSQWFGLLAVPQNFYAGLGKYPLLAIPMFVLVGSIFDRSGVALRLVNFAVASVGRGPGMLPLVAIAVAMFLGGISGSGPANAAAVGGVMIAAMSRAGYQAASSAGVVAADSANYILITPPVS